MVAQSDRMSSEQYLEMERASEEKHEFFRGQVYAMVGASREHNLITDNISGELRVALRDRPCEAYSSDMRVKSQSIGLYTYPDVVVVWGKPVFEDAQVDTLLNPRVVFEVLSGSTEKYDRGEKSRRYRTIASLTDYVLVSQDEPLIEHYSLQPDGDWRLHIAGPGTVLTLASIDVTLKVDEVYLKVFDPAS